MAKVYDLDEFVEKKIADDGLELTVKGEKFIVDPPLLWGTERSEEIKKGNEDAAKALLGDRYEKFVELGGSPEKFAAVVSDAFFSDSSE